MVTFLACQSGRHASRATAISLLWADLAPDKGKHALRQTLWYIKKRVGRDIIDATDDELRLIKDVEVDRDALLDASRRGDDDAVTRHYSGTFLPGFSAPGAAGFERWLEGEQRHLFQVFASSAERLITRHIASARPREALDLARRLRDQDPSADRSWQLLLEAAIASGDALAARVEADAAQALIDREDLEPAPATLALLRSARASRESADSPPPPGDHRLEGELVGRDREFFRLTSAWQVASRGRGAHLHIVGRAGLGKSRLLTDFGRHVRAMRGRVVAVRGNQGARGLGFALAADLAGALAVLPGARAVSTGAAATLIDLNPSLTSHYPASVPIPSPADPERTYALALRELIEAISGEKPLALLIDDLHWADEPSRRLLQSLVASTDGRHLLVVTASRPSEGMGRLTSGDRTIALRPLAAIEVNELVRSIADLPDDTWASRFSDELWAATRGSPLLTLETLMHLDQRGVLRRDKGSWVASDPPALFELLRSEEALEARVRDLDAKDKELASILAVAGMDLTLEVLARSLSASAEETALHLSDLERRGFVAREGIGWRLAHDDIADEVLAHAGAEGQREARVAVARALVSGDDRATRSVWHIAGPLLAESGDAAALGDLFRRFARDQFRRGARRSLSALARDLVGSRAEVATVSAMVRSAPLAWRAGLISGRRIALVASLVVATLTLTRIWLTGQPDPDATFSFITYSSDERLVSHRVDVRAADWNALAPLLPSRVDGPSADVRSMSSLIVSAGPNGVGLLTSEVTGDSGVIDMFAYTPLGQRTRLTHAPGDDMLGEVDPTGRWIAFVTARWDSLSHYDLALLDLEGNAAVVPLTSGPATDLSPVWSPNSERLAFERNNWGERADELCVIGVAARELRCRPVDVGTQPVGWLDGDRLALLRGEENRRLTVLQWSTGEEVVVREGPIGGLWLSRDAQWAVCRCALSPDGEMQLAVFPMSAPALARRVELPADAGSLRAVYWQPSRAVQSDAVVRIAEAGPEFAIGVPYQLRARITDARGLAQVGSGTLRWSSSDPSVALVDSGTGILTGRSAGAAEISARSGDAGSTPLVARVVARDPRALLTEGWSDSSLGRWFLFGDPPPRAVRLDDGRHAFFNNGDGSFTSGVLSRVSFSGRRGLAVATTFSAPVRLRQWQQFALALNPFVDSSVAARTQGRNGLPAIDGDQHACEFALPMEERRFRPRTSSLAASGARHQIPAPEVWFDGSWRQLVVQLFPDGACGLAIDGVPLLVVNGTRRTIDGLRLLIVGNSYRTRVLLGPLEVIEGVPPGIDWGKAPRVP